MCASAASTVWEAAATASVSLGIVRACIERELTTGFRLLYAELREKFSLTPEDLPHPPRERMAE